MTSNDSLVVCLQDSYNSERNLSVWFVVAVGLLIARSDARYSLPLLYRSHCQLFKFRRPDIEVQYQMRTTPGI